MSTSLFGTSVLRREDGRLLRGEGRYLDDIVLPGMLHVAGLRSPHPHARIRSIDAAGARALDGVVDIVAHADLGPAGEPFPLLLSHHGLIAATWRALAAGRVRFVGEAVAAVVATTREAAIEAAEAVAIDYELLPAILDVETAIEPGAPLVHEAAAQNLAMRLTEGCGDAEAALRAAPRRIVERIRIRRGAGMPMEPRGVIASYDPHTRELMVWSSTQEPHTGRSTIASLLGLPRRAVRVIAPDTGGGFGTKLNIYPEEVLVPWLALRLRRPVKWVETRAEHMLAATQEREQIHDVEVGFDANGTILALKDRFLHDMGAYAPRGGAVPHNTSSALPGPYRIANLRSEMLAVYTNKVTVSAYRGAGQPQGVFVIERIMDRIAQHVGKDPAEVRLINTIPTDQFPFDTGLSNLLGGAVEYDSGDFIGTLQKALGLSGYKALRAEQAEALKAGRLLGVGIASYVELTGRGPWEGGGVRVEPDGNVTVYTGAPSQGQGHETTFAQICADHLGISIERITVLGGDTSLIAHGIGTFASRVGVLTGNAVRQAAIEVKEKILRIAENLLEAHPADLEVEDGRVSIRGVPGKHVGFAEVARVAFRAAGPDAEAPGLEATHYFKGPKMTYSNGTHIAAVEVDAETGAVVIRKYFVAHDCGRMINPTIVEGQIQGGVACGIGNALLEEHVYDTAGQLVSGSFMDYAMPRACDVPSLEIVHQECPSTLNPLGLKGAGEAGTIPVPAAICSAIEDALRPLGVKISEAPLTAHGLWRLIARREAAIEGR